MQYKIYKRCGWVGEVGVCRWESGGDLRPSRGGQVRGRELGMRPCGGLGGVVDLHIVLGGTHQVEWWVVNSVIGKTHHEVWM